MCETLSTVIPVPPGNDVPAVPAFTPDRLGIRRVSIDVDRDTNAYRSSFTPCPATATQWGPTDLAEVSSPDLVAELLAAPDSADKLAALEAVQRIQADLITVAGFVLTLREDTTTTV